MTATALHAFNTANWTLDHSLAVQTREIGEPYEATCGVYLVEHPEATVLFDTGLSHELARDPEGYGAPWMAAFREGIDLEAGAPPAEALDEAGFEPGDVDIVVCSHLHTDHAGNLDQFPDAEVVVQVDELRYSGYPTGAQELFYVEADLAPLRAPGADVRGIRGRHDVLGDGSVVAVPTPGHSPGHQALRVELDSGPVFLAADTALHRTGWEAELVAAFTWNQEEAVASIRSLREEARRADGDVVIHHDPAEFGALAAESRR